MTGIMSIDLTNIQWSDMEPWARQVAIDLIKQRIAVEHPNSITLRVRK